MFSLSECPLNHVFAAGKRSVLSKRCFSSGLYAIAIGQKDDGPQNVSFFAWLAQGRRRFYEMVLDK